MGRKKKIRPKVKHRPEPTNTELAKLDDKQCQLWIDRVTSIKYNGDHDSDDEEYLNSVINKLENRLIKLLHDRPNAVKTSK